MNSDLALDDVREPCFAQDDLVRVFVAFPSSRNARIRAGPPLPFAEDTRYLHLQLTTLNPCGIGERVAPHEQDRSVGPEPRCRLLRDHRTIEPVERVPRCNDIDAPHREVDVLGTTE